MAGTYSPSALPPRPGAYFRFEAGAQPVRLESTLGTVAVAFTADWGPEEVVVELNQPSDYLVSFGQGADPNVPTEGQRVVTQAFKGEGIPGSGGAGKVLAFRMIGAAGLEASKAHGPAAALTVRGKYKGTYGNRLKTGVEPDAKSPATVDNFVVFDGLTEVERFKYTKTDINDLGAQINGTGLYVGGGGSKWLRTSGAITSGTALTATVVPGGQTLADAATALTGGNDGLTLLAADYTAWMTALGPQKFGVIAPANLTDSTILASLKTWHQTRNRNGKRCMLVVGGATDEALSVAITRSQTLNDPDIVNLGVGSVQSEWGVLSTAQLAPRIAGLIAALGTERNLTFAALAGLTIINGPSDSDYVDALTSGVVLLARSSHPQASVRLDKGVTTFTSTSDVQRPFSIYSIPKFVRTMHDIESEITEWAEVEVVGRMQISDATRQFVLGQVQARMQRREDRQVIQPGWKVEIDENPPPQDTDDFVALRYGLVFGRGVERLFNRVIVK